MADEKPVAERTEDASESRSVPEKWALPPWVPGLLACPVDLSAVRLEGSELVCDQCGRRYLIVSGIARMMADQPESEQQF
ncbi:MAG TPA: hypothetical protein VHG52_05515 [Thermomicrobiales bacterium]|nr:hypothetical protein [Thermomicrobiales bacterium]